LVARLVCPIGAALRDKRPEVIAALATAEVLHALVAAPIPLPAVPGPASP
jgi:xanthine/CO dehydrogenase XdhC/CoxF family maturation factor